MKDTQKAKNSNDYTLLYTVSILMRHKYSATQLAHAFCIRRPIQNTYTPPRVLVHTDLFFGFFFCISDCFDLAVFRFEYISDDQCRCSHYRNQQ